MKTTQSFCQPLLFLNFLSRYPDNWFSRARWWSIIATEVALLLINVCHLSSCLIWTSYLCQQTCTELLDLWPEGLESRLLDISVISDLSRPSSLPDMDFKLRYLLLPDDSMPRSLANWNGYMEIFWIDKSLRHSSKSNQSFKCFRGGI